MSSLHQVQEVLPVPHLPPCAGAGQHFKRTRKLTGPPKPLPPKHEEPLSLHGRLCQWPTATHCTTVYTSSVTAVQHKARTAAARNPNARQPLTCSTRWTALRLPTLQRRTSRRPQASHTCKAPPPCDCLCSPGPGSACPYSISQFKTAHAGAPHPAGPHHSTHLAPQHAPHALPDSARHDGSRTRQQTPRRNAAALSASWKWTLSPSRRRRRRHL